MCTQDTVFCCLLTCLLAIYIVIHKLSCFDINWCVEVTMKRAANCCIVVQILFANASYTAELTNNVLDNSTVFVSM